MDVDDMCRLVGLEVNEQVFPVRFGMLKHGVVELISLCCESSLWRANNSFMSGKFAIQ